MEDNLLPMTVNYNEINKKGFKFQFGVSNDERYNLFCAIGIAIILNEVEMKIRLNPQVRMEPERSRIFDNLRPLERFLMTYDKAGLIQEIRREFPPDVMRGLNLLNSLLFPNPLIQNPLKGLVKKIDVELFNIVTNVKPKCDFCDFFLASSEFLAIQKPRSGFEGSYHFKHVIIDWNARLIDPPWDERCLNLFYARGHGIRTFPCFIARLVLDDRSTHELLFPVFDNATKVAAPANLWQYIDRVQSRSFSHEIDNEPSNSTAT